ncbi:hypothetical protein TNCV_4761771 [Trichonephila clavipes]|nr:hypothetical protein TNCV_4761771 [Trichonephila clavipes]
MQQNTRIFFETICQICWKICLLTSAGTCGSSKMDAQRISCFLYQECSDMEYPGSWIGHHGSASWPTRSPDLNPS